MEVIIERDNIKPFYKVNVGEAFICRDTLMVKLKPVYLLNTAKMNAYNIDDNTLDKVEDSELVQMVNLRVYATKWMQRESYYTVKEGEK